MNNKLNVKKDKIEDKTQLFSNPIHGSHGQEKQILEIKKNNKIINEFVNHIFYYFWSFFDYTNSN